MRKLTAYLFQPQFVTIFNGEEQHWLPYTMGSVWAYAIQSSQVQENWNLGGFFFRRDAIADVLERLQDPDLCAFSVYIWNQQYCLALAQQIKLHWPQCKIVMGGPQVSSSWTAHDFIDSMIFNEGERCFEKILNTLAQGQQLDLFYSMPRMDSLDSVPSPMSSGLFNQLVEENPDIYWSASLETTRGCPYSCTFCDWGGLTASKIKKFSLERVQQDLVWIAQHQVKNIFITDANFGIFKERDLAIAKMVRYATELPGSHLEYISATYAKNSTEHVFQIARELGPKHKGITFSVQSMNPDTLDAIKRKNMDVNDVKDLLDLGHKYNVYHYTELILGLPLETKETWKDGICQILEMGQHFRLEIHPNNLLEHTEMHDSQKNQYDMQLVYTQNIVPLSGRDPSGIAELFPTVCSTNTMSTNDMIESWLYSWTVIHFHINGYSQILAKFCRRVLGIPYRQFYDRLFEKLNLDTGVLGQEIMVMRQVITSYYTQGHTGREDVPAGTMTYFSAPFFYDHLEETVNFGLELAQEFGEIDPAIIEIQRRYINNDVWPAPFSTQCNYDINDWTSGRFLCVIDPPADQLTTDTLTLFTLQRRARRMFNLISISPDHSFTGEKLRKVIDIDRIAL